MSDNTKNELDENVDELELVAEEQAIPEIDSKYRMILLAAQRSKQLQRGATARVNMDIKKTKPTRIAIEELKQKKVHFRILEQE